MMQNINNQLCKEVLRMDNYEAIAYASVALAQLQNEGKEVKQDFLKG
jgi:hypothetical protein